MLDAICEEKEIEFESTAYYIFVDGKLKLEVGYEAVIIDENDEEENID